MLLIKLRLTVLMHKSVSVKKFIKWMGNTEGYGRMGKYMLSIQWALWLLLLTWFNFNPSMDK